MAVLGPRNRGLDERLPRLAAEPRVNRRDARHESGNARHRRARRDTANPGRIRAERRQMRDECAHAVELVGAARLRLPVNERDRARVVRHVELHGGLRDRAGHRGINRVPSALQHVQHRLRDDRMLARGDGFHAACDFLVALMRERGRGGLGISRACGANEHIGGRAGHRGIAKEFTSVHGVLRESQEILHPAPLSYWVIELLVIGRWPDQQP